MKVKIRDIIPYVRNSKKHPDAQISRLMGMIDEYGFTSPLVVVGKELKAGHGRVEAARRILDSGGHIYPAPGRKNGAEPFEDGMLPAIDATGWSEAQARAYVIAENRIAELAEWDSEMLALEIEDLRLGGFDIDLTGFDSAQLETILNAGAGVGEQFTGDINSFFNDSGGEIKQEKVKLCPHCKGVL
jgi:ParB-like chromosome segregation protein Spo0J